MAQDNRALAARYQGDLLQARRLEVADEIIASEFAMHSPGIGPDLAHGPEGVKRQVEAISNAVPDLQITADDVVANGDKVVIRWTMTGTHRGELFGIPPSGRRFSVSGIDVFRIEHEQIAELWRGWDQFGLFQQIGAVLSPAPV